MRFWNFVEVIALNINLRLEEEKDYKIVENVTREAFWNLHAPGCEEHMLIHKMRKAPEFIKELDFVVVLDDKIVGNIVYVKSKVIDGPIEHEVLTFGPVSVLQEYQNKGIGSTLINHTISLATKMGYNAIIIYGAPNYYQRFGFEPTIKFKITNSEKRYPVSLLALELYPDALNGVEGVFDEGIVYQIDKSNFDEFDKQFPFKEKAHTETQDWFMEISSKYHGEG